MNYSEQTDWIGGEKIIKVFIKSLSIQLSKQTLMIWLGFVFCFSLYSSSNVGGDGLDLPFNVMIWGGICLFIVSTVMRGVVCQRIQGAMLVWVLWGVLLGLLVVGALDTNFETDAFMQTTFNFVVIGLFFWALFQYKLTPLHFIKLLIFLCILGAVQSLIAIVQTNDVYKIGYTLVLYEPFKFIGTRPLGSFQQVNMLASFLAFTLVATLYVMSTQFFLHKGRLAKIGLLVCVLLCAYVLFVSGSRAGLLSFLLAGPLMLIARHQVFWRNGRNRHNRVFCLGWFLALSLAFFLSMVFPGNAAGLEFALEKTAGLSEGIRPVLYQHSFALFMQTPLTGLGIGNFIEPFAEYVNVHQISMLSTGYYTHPHNEWLYWMLQSGMVALVLPLFFVGYFLYLLFQKKFRFFLAILALIMPFAIQSQLSYPFSLSSLHLFIPLFLMYVGTRRYVTTYRFSMDSGVQKSVLIALCGVGLIILFSAWHSLKSIKELYIFENSLFYTQFQTKEEIASQRYLKQATHNLLYREKAITAMNFMVNKAIESNNQYDLGQFVGWAMDRGGEISQLSLLNLARVSLAQGKIEQAERVAKRMFEQYGISLNLAVLQSQVDALKAAKKGNAK